MKYCVLGYTLDEQYILRFGESVRELRFAAGHLQKHFANLCDVEASQISRIELGKINTSLPQSIRIAAALHMEMKGLFDFDFRYYVFYLKTYPKHKYEGYPDSYH